MTNVKTSSCNLLIRLLSLLIVFFLIVSTVFLYDVSAYEKDNEKRIVALVLDCSGSMSGTPLIEMKEAAVGFCESVIEKSSDTQIVLVTYSNKANLYEKTNDINKLTEIIEGLRAYEKSNLYDALDKTNDYIKSLDGDYKKTIVIMSDGLPNCGQKYQLSDSEIESNSDFDVSYVNAVCGYIENYLYDYKIITLGFYHSVENQDELLNIQKFMNDIQNAGYYDVKDGSKLFYTFQTVADDIAEDFSYEQQQNMSDIPVIIVPGIMGCKLFFDKECTKKAWDPVTFPLPDLSKISYNGTVYVKEPSLDEEYGALDYYKTMITHLRKKMPDRKVYFFSYDFRKDNKYTAKLLEDFINENGWEKVDLVCHSMGGLVLSFYSLNNYEKINHAITVATPYEGAAFLLEATMADKTTDDPKIDLTLTLLGLTVGVKRTFPSLIQLSPSESYFSYVQKNFDSEHNFRIGDTKRKMTLEDYRQANETIFGKNYKKYSSCLSEIYNDDGKIKLLDYKNTYFVIGTGIPTAVSVLYDIDKTNGTFYKLGATYTSEGDATVPYISSTNVYKISNENYPGRVLVCPESKYGYDLSNHTGILNNMDALDWIADICIKGYSELSFKDNEDEINGYIIVKVDSTADVTVKYGNKKISSKSHENISDFGRIDYYGKDNEIKYVILDDDKDYDILIFGNDDSFMDYTVTKYDSDDNITEESCFEDIHMTAETELKADIKSGEKLSLVSLNDASVFEPASVKLSDHTEKSVERQSLENNNSLLKTENLSGKKITVNYIIPIIIGLTVIITIMVIIISLNKRKNNKIN